MFGPQGAELFDGLYNAIKRWQPSQHYAGEDGYRNELMEYVRLNSTREHIVKSESGRSLADIAVDKTIGIELKLNFKKKSQLDRLIGQLDTYLEEYRGVIVVLCGESNQSLVEELRAKLRQKRNSSGGLMGSELMLGVVEVGKP